MVLIGHKWLYSGRVVYLGKVVFIGQKWLYSVKVVALGQKLLYSGKVAVFFFLLQNNYNIS